MVYLGIDYGRSRIGLALSETGHIARSLGYIKNKGDAKNVAAVGEVCKKYNCMCIVCGIPLYTDGTESEMSREARRFGELLRVNLGTEVFYHDERYTSIDAEEYIREKMGVKNHEKIKELVDGVAASMILQDWLCQSCKVPEA